MNRKLLYFQLKVSVHIHRYYVWVRARMCVCVGAYICTFPSTAYWMKQEVASQYP